MKRGRRWPKKKRASEDGRTATSMYKSADARDFHKPLAMMTAIDAPPEWHAQQRRHLDVKSGQSI
jgi:hypothetical protein